MLDNGVEIALDGCVWVTNPLDDGVGIAIGCVWIFSGQVAGGLSWNSTDGCIWVCMGDESISHTKSLNSKLSFYILLTTLHLPLNSRVSDSIFL